MAALKSILKDRLANTAVYTLEDKFSFNKTKEAIILLEALTAKSEVKAKTSILVYTTEDKANIKGFLNTDVKMINATNLKIFKLANAQTLLLTPEATKILEAKIVKNK